MKEKGHGVGVLNYRLPIRWDLNGADVLRALVGVGTDEVKGETPNTKADGLFPERGQLTLRSLDRVGLQLAQRRKPQLKNPKQRNVAERHGSFSVLRDGAPRRRNIQLVHQLVENAQTKDAMIYARLQKFRHLLRQLAVRGVVEPAELRDPAN